MLDVLWYVMLFNEIDDCYVVVITGYYFIFYETEYDVLTTDNVANDFRERFLVSKITANKKIFKFHNVDKSNKFY